MSRCVVVTTILQPSPQLIEHCRRGLHDATDVIVVADRKTPVREYEALAAEFSNLHVLSLDRQHDLFPRLSSALPFNHYARKNVGYAYAMSRGHVAIFDTDDDNASTGEWQHPAHGERRVRIIRRGGAAAMPAFFNVYSLYTSTRLWPRGFPLEHLRAAQDACDVADGDLPDRVAVWQGLVDGDPDVDAIARLTSSDGGEGFRFDATRMRVVLDRGTLCPINSQNTWWIDRPSFDLLFLPGTATFRVCDILRGYVAQQALWARGARAGFVHATAVQARNPHDLMADFASELPLYLQATKMNQVLYDVSRQFIGGPEDLTRAYDALAKADLVDPREAAVADAWLAAIS
jgi:hypothetical protein